MVGGDRLGESPGTLSSGEKLLYRAIQRQLNGYRIPFDREYLGV